MTGRTGAVRKAIRNRFRTLRSLMAFFAGDRQMRFPQGESCALMLRDRVRGRLEPSQGMALLAPIPVRRPRKLPFMRILVAILALREANLVAGGCSGRHMAFVAGDSGMLAIQPIPGRGMHLYVKERRLPSLDRMAFGALPLLLPSGELAAMRVGSMAIRAFHEGNRPLKVSSVMAFQAVHLSVLSEERILCLRVIELALLAGLFPAVGRVAYLARFGEGPVMDIGMAVGATLEGYSPEPRFPSRLGGCVAFFAGNMSMISAEWVATFRMVEILGSLPINEVVALQAILAELALVYVLMAAPAILR